jgi:hypothetical protein
MSIPRFDIFAGLIDANASRIETVEGLGNAYELMTQLAERSPGSYFILDSRTHIVRGSIDTSISPPHPAKALHHAAQTGQPGTKR